jgi:hypothetical protein
MIVSIGASSLSFGFESIEQRYGLRHNCDPSSAGVDDPEYLELYGIRLPLLKNWQKVTDRDFPLGAIVYIDDKHPNEMAFISVLPEREAEKELAGILSMQATGKKIIDGHIADVIETDKSEDNVHIMIFVFNNVKYKGSPVLLIAFGKIKSWDKISGDVNKLIENVKIK